MAKDFDGWNRRKKRLDRRVRVPHAYPREIWWCAFGVNIGVETDGKHADFERPAVILRVYNLDTVLVLPLTSIQKDDRYHFQIETTQGSSWVKLTQSRVISSKRLLSKLETIDQPQFKRLRAAFIRFI